ncbi:MAG TPA: arginine--tRNA ligase [Gemmatimonadaceae bacterium]|nr:arginine--tRNA ligase [Gemmatimonadaceae bacterium]
MTQRDTIRAALVEAARALGAPEPIDPVIERPRDPAHGEWATNLAMTLARPLKRKPREIAEALVSHLSLGDIGVERVEIAGPGFINFRMSAGANARGLAAVVAADESYGRAAAGQGCRVVVEFVSANPTGPLHVGHGRQAALGDAISSLLEWTGWSVSREFYYNDAGVQIQRLAESVQARLFGVLADEASPLAARGSAEIPDGGYHGEYIREVAEQYLREVGDLPWSEERALTALDLDQIRRFAVQALRREQDLDLRAFGVRFDTYFLESSLYEPGSARASAPELASGDESAVEATVRTLVSRGMTHEREGALWLETTRFGDDKDRVMRKSDGTYTYFVPDVAYHVTKWERGFPRAINVQGSDHHSTVTRVRAGLQALKIGIPEGYPEYVLHQMVTVVRGGEEVKISKRAGSYVTVRDLIEWVGRDAVRYFYLMRKGDSQLVFDVDLAVKQSEENPIYYIQMAHARMSGIFRVGGIDPQTVTGADVDFSILREPEEQELIKALLDFPALVAGAAEALEPHRVASYLLETARLVHLWYHKHHVLNEPDEITRARLVLARAARVVLRNGLAILGISAPDRM